MTHKPNVNLKGGTNVNLNEFSFQCGGGSINIGTASSSLEFWN